jgi:hypothetical protein
MEIKMGVIGSAMCADCGELFEYGNATTAIGVIENGTITKLYCASCFIDRIAEHIPDNIKEAANKLISGD